MRPAGLYVFQLGTTGRFALSVDKTGCNLPQDDLPDKWLLQAELALECLDAMELTLQHILTTGYLLLPGAPENFS